MKNGRTLVSLARTLAQSGDRVLKVLARRELRGDS